MGLGEDIKDYLSTGGVTASIFIGEEPEKPDLCLAVTPTGGLGPSRTMSGSAGTAPVEHCRVQIRSRGLTYAAAEGAIAGAYQLLSGMPARTLNDRAYYYASPTSTPLYLGLDDANRATFAANFDVWRCETT